MSGVVLGDDDAATIQAHLQLSTSTSLGVSAFYHKTPSAEASTPQGDQSWVCVLRLASGWPLGSPDSISSFQPVTAPFGGIGEVFGCLPMGLPSDSYFP